MFFPLESHDKNNSLHFYSPCYVTKALLNASYALTNSVLITYLRKGHCYSFPKEETEKQVNQL